MAPKEKEAKKEKVIVTSITPAPEPTPGPTVAEAVNAASVYQPTAEEQELLRRANERAVNHEAVEKTFEAVSKEEAEERRAASAEEINDFLASDEANIDPTARKLTKKEIDAQRKADADKAAADKAAAKNKVTTPPTPPAPDNDIPKP